MFKSILKKCFFIFTVLFLLSGVIRTVFFEKDINNYECRPAIKLDSLSARGYSSGTFQSSMEKALGDQIPFAQYFKKLFNILKSDEILSVTNPLMDSHPEYEYRQKKLKLYRGYALYDMLSYTPEMYDTFITSFSKILPNNPDTDFYFYYIETDLSNDVVNGVKNPVFGYLFENLDIPSENTGCLSFDGFDDYSNLFLKTDHHWNCEGAYTGYKEILSLMYPNENPVEILDKKILSYPLSGSKSRISGLFTLSEKFEAYIYNLPEFLNPFGMEKQYIDESTSDNLSYGLYYCGSESDINVELQTGDDEKENLLIIGDSNNSAVIKLLASHCNRTFFMDIRQNNGTNVTDFIRSQNFSKVLILVSDYSFDDYDILLEG